MTATVARAWCEREGLAAPDRFREAPHGTVGGFRHVAGRLCRVVEFDPHGTLLTLLAWHPDGRLASARVRVPDGSWLIIEPRAVTDPRWGASDRLSSAAGALTHFEATAWEAVDRIPVLAEPARVPPGGGTSVLNLIATLAADQGRTALVYHGPYPTEALFLSLLESFRPQAPAADALAGFARGALTWRPQPHERVFDPAPAVVQLRGRVEKVTAGGRVYYRPDWHGIPRHAPRRVRDVDGGVACSLWALGAPLEDHLLLASSGEVVERRDPAPATGDARPFPSALVTGVVAAVVASSAPPLAEALADVAAGVRLEWGPVPGDLVRATGDGLRVSERLWAAARVRAAGADRRVQIAVATATLVEVAQLVADDLRGRAQARLAGAPAAVQAAALARTSLPDEAAEIAAAVDALAAQLVA